ncbi:MAG: bifunctional UDP-N-acetylglucosamine diphosphorylase/glucosamine-1-phosphate N-acetyltransferase GlmU [Gammaproteobacteria bacterium]|nr:bifunctional UDP-N-acetylglucosamine diphosphorylase/glucosamine-1-phosphate N-acetyltransferase GlmU [Gammaproteobacteria bacterium]
MQLSVVILAAGQGRRMNSDLPKVLQPLAGAPLLRHVVDAVRALAPAAIHVVHGHGGERVRAALPDPDLDWVLQAEQLGTGHAVRQALPHIPDEHGVLILYGDVPLIEAATLRRLAVPAARGSLALLTADVADPRGYGRIVRDPHGRIAKIVEERDADADQRAIREVNTGLLAAPAGTLRRLLDGVRADNAQREYYLTDVVGLAVADGIVVDAIEAPSTVEVMGVNDKCQLAEAEAALRQRRARALMEAGATLADPARIDVRGEVRVGRDVFLDANVVLEGRVTLGDRVRIGPNCCLRDVTLGADTQVHANCVLEEAIVGEDCRIGPFARLRPGARLHARVHVGNFVEVKNSELGEGSKANHLTYLGDATVGRDVNVGAGTITCNYDGQNKWPTVIGDAAFIGSGAMLVAPVRIGAGATIGAGSTITANTPAGQLALARAKQVSVEGWERPAKATSDAKAARIADSLGTNAEPPKK